MREVCDMMDVYTAGLHADYESLLTVRPTTRLTRDQAAWFTPPPSASQFSPVCR